jgi:hypothetical protein
MRDTAPATATADERLLLERLRADCDVAFRNWAAQVRVLQSVSSGDPPDSGAVQQARRWVDEAATIYREKRNLLVEFIMRSPKAAEGAYAPLGDGDREGPNAGGAAENAPRARTQQVQRLARQIWEESGRPDGTAEEDWYRAEQILDTRR